MEALIVVILIAAFGSFIVEATWIVLALLYGAIVYPLMMLRDLFAGKFNRRPGKW